MRIGKLTSKLLLTAGILLVLFGVSTHYGADFVQSGETSTHREISFVSVAYAQSDNLPVQETSFVHHFFDQLRGVWSFTAQAIQAVLDVNTEKILDASTTSPSLKNTPDIQNSVISNFTIPKLPEQGNSSLVINLPLVETNSLTVQGVSNLATTTIHNFFSVSGSTELNALLVRATAQAQALIVSGSARINELSVTGNALFRSASISADANVGGTLTARGGIKTSGADVDLEGGKVFASNVVNELIAGRNITISGTPDAPIISARQVSIPRPDLAEVRARGGCPECLIDSDIAPSLTISGGLINDTTIGLTTASQAAFTDVRIGTVSATSTLQVNGRIVVVGTASSTFDGGINVINGCVAVNGICLGGGVVGINDLSDVIVTSPATDDFLSYNGTHWVNIAASTLGLGDGTFLGLTDTPSSYLAQAISFVNSGGTGLTQSTDFVFDGSRLGVGTSTPSSKLTVYGDVFLEGSSRYLNFGTASGTVGYGLRDNAGTLEFKNSGQSWGQYLPQSGLNWETATAVGDNDGWKAVAYGNGLFVAVGSSGDRVMTSPDGINWTARSGSGDWSSITYGNGLFVAVANSGTSNRVMTSPDGINWTLGTSVADNNWLSVTYGNGLFVAVGYSGNRVMTSPDGITWTERSVAGDDDSWSSVTYGNGTFVAVSNAGVDRIMTSPNGITWTTVSGDGAWSSVTYGNGLFVAVGNYGADYVMTSPDGTTWTIRSSDIDNDSWTSVTYGNGLFVAVASPANVGDSRVMTSPNGIVWTSRSAADDNDSWSAVTYGNDTFVAVGSAGNRVMNSGATNYSVLAHNNTYQGGMNIFGNVGIGTSAPTDTLTVAGTVGILGQQALRFYNPTNSNYVGFKASSTVSSNMVWSLPAGDGSANQQLVTDGAGNLRFASFGGVSILDDLDDVIVATSSAGDLLLYNGVNWVNSATSSLGIGADTLVELDDVTIAGVTQGDLLSYNGASWINIATSTLGLGDGTFLGLTDTPSSYLAQAISFVNSGGTGLTQSADFVFDGSQLGIGTSTPTDTLTVAGTVGILGQQALRFYNPTNSNYVGFKASTTVSSNMVWSLPAGDGSADQLLVTDGAGNLRFANVGSVGGGSSTFLGLTDTPNSFVNKAIPYVATNTLAFSSNFVFDGTRLGIGNNVPSAELTVQGSVLFQSSTSTVGFVYNQATNRVGIGTNNPTERLALEGGSFLQQGARSGSTYTPTQMSSIDLPDNANDVHILGAYAYVVTSSAGNDFHIIDISDATAPVEVGSLNLADSANAVSVAGRYAYVVTDVNGNDFHVIDIINPAVPVEVGSLNLSTSATDVFIQGRYAYVTTSGTGTDFHIIDISNPLLPKEVSSLEMSDGANAVAVVGTYAYVVTNAISAGFYVINVIAPDSPSIVGTLVMPAATNDVVVQGGYAYAVSDDTGNDFHVINISNPAAPAEVGALNLVTSANAVSIAGHYAYITTAGTGDDFHVIDITSTTAPIEVGSEELAAGAGLSVAVSGRNAYVVTSSPGDDFHVIDVTGVSAQSAFVASLEAGTLSTQGRLSVAGSGVFGKGLRTGLAGIQTDGSLYVQGTSASYIRGSFGIGTTSPASVLDVWGDLRVGTSSVPALFVKTNIGNVGIGTTTPSQKLSVAGNMHLTGSLYDSINSAGSAGYILRSTGSGVEWVATSTLSGSGGVSFTTSAELAAILTDETGTGRSVFSASPAFSGTATFSALTATSTLTLSGTSANIALGSNYLSGDGGDEGVFVDGSGNVGIGTSAPTGSKLEVVGGDLRLGATYQLEFGGNTEGFRVSSNSLHLFGRANTRVYIDANSSGNFAFEVYGNVPESTNTDALFTVRDTGNVGIGTTTPTTLLSVSGTSTMQSILPAVDAMYSLGSPTNRWKDIYVASSSLYIGDDEANQVKLSYDATDDVLNVSGGSFYSATSSFNSLTVIGSLYDSTNSAGTNGMILQSTGTGTHWVATSTLGIGGVSFTTSAELAAILSDETGTGNAVFSASPTFTGTLNAAAATLSSTLTLSGTSANIALGSNFLSGDGGDEGVYVSSVGNVGIGTTSPLSKLDIYGDAILSGSNRYLNFGLTSGTSGYGIRDNGGTLQFKNSGQNWEQFSPQAGVNWVTSAPSIGGNWQDIVYGNGRFVSVEQTSGLVTYSPDGVNWATTTASEIASWVSLAYGNGLFVAVANSGTNQVMTSSDGINWTSRSAAEANLWRNVAYGNGLFVAVSSDGTNRVMTSPDGITWTSQSASAANSWLGITYGNGLFVAVASSGTGNRVMTSPDGITWTSRTTTEANVWFSVAYGNGRFVAVASSGTDNRVMTSPDGITWTAQSVPEVNSWHGVTYGNGLFVAVAYNGTNRVMTSPDGITWTLRNNEAGGWYDVAYGNGRFVAIGYNGTYRALVSGNPETNILSTNNIYHGGMSIFGNVGIGITNPTYKLQVNGQPAANGYTAWTNYSDQRLKENITDLATTTDASALSKLKLLRPVTFNYNDLTGYDEETRARRVSGFIAQELREVFPTMVGTTTINGVEYLDTNTSDLSLYLILGIQELDASLEELLTYGTTTSTSTFAFLNESDTIWSRLVTLARGFVDGVLHIAAARIGLIQSDSLETDTLCVGTVCVTQEEFNEVFGSSNHSVSPVDVPDTNTDIDTDSGTSSPDVDIDEAMQETTPDQTSTTTETVIEEDVVLLEPVEPEIVEEEVLTTIDEIGVTDETGN
jgi:hypothetical protein